MTNRFPHNHTLMETQNFFKTCPLGNGFQNWIRLSWIIAAIARFSGTEIPKQGFQCPTKILLREPEHQIIRDVSLQCIVFLFEALSVLDLLPFLSPHGGMRLCSSRIHKKFRALLHRSSLPYASKTETGKGPHVWFFKCKHYEASLKPNRGCQPDVWTNRTNSLACYQLCPRLQPCIESLSSLLSVYFYVGFSDVRHSTRNRPHDLLWYWKLALRVDC